MNRILAFIATATVIGLATHIAGFKDPQSLKVLAVGLSVILVGSFVLKSHHEKLGRGQSLIDEFDHPFAALCIGAIRGAIYIALLGPVFWSAWGLGAWRTPWQSDAADVAVDDLRSVGQKSPQPIQLHVPLYSVEIVNAKHVEGMEFLEVIVRDDAQKVVAVPDATFAVTIPTGDASLASARAAQYFRPARFEFLRDVSSSIVEVQPFGGLSIEATTAFLSELRTDDRDLQIRIADFAGTAEEALPWSIASQIGNAPPLRRLPAANATALNDVLAATINGVGDDNWDVHVICATDGGNNVHSGFDRHGLAAAARKRGVVLHFVTLPTQHLTPTALETLTQLATSTNGFVVDGASPTLRDEVQRLVEATRRPIPSWKLTFASDTSVEPANIRIKVVPAAAVDFVASSPGL